MYKYITIYLFSVVHLLSVAKAQDDNINTLLNMSLEDLMNVEVTGASRREENQTSAPGVISIVTAQEIRQFGARHLRDVLDRMVNMQIIGAHNFPHSKTSLRATNGSMSDNNILPLLNGRPLRNGLIGGHNNDIYSGFPLETIHHIEIIRGPGSVIYGSNAMAGVINIVTHNQQEEVPDQSSLEVSMGSFSQQQVQITKNVQAKDYRLTTGLHLARSAGDDFSGITDESGHTDTYKTGEDLGNLVVSGNYQHFSFNAMITSTTSDNASGLFQLPSKTTHLKRRFLDLGYQYNLTDTWSASFNYTFDQGILSWMANNDNHFSVRMDGKEQQFELIVQGQPIQAAHILLGFNYSDSSGEAVPTVPYRVIQHRSVFAQTDYSFDEKQKIIGGFQWNKLEKGAGDFSPRIGFIQGFGEHWWLKLLYSKAFRSPSPTEIFADAPALVGNPDLKPEKIATFDAQLIYQTAKQQFALTLYRSAFTDIITSVLIPGSVRVTQANKGEINFRGVEFEGRVALNDDFTLVGNATYQRNEDDEGIKNNTFAPNTTVKLGFTYTGKPGLTLGVFDSYIGESTDLTETLGNPAINPTAKDYHLLTANLSVDTGKFLGVGKPNRSFISLYLDNLLNEDVYAPDLFHRGKNNTIPHHWGLGAYLNYQYRF